MQIAMNSVDSPSRESTSKVITIDLTHDDSPSVMKHAAQVVPVAGPREEKIPNYIQQLEQPLQACSENEDLPSPDVRKTYPKFMRSVSPQEVRSRYGKVPTVETKNPPSIGPKSRGENKRHLAVDFDLQDDEHRPHIRDMGGRNRKNLPSGTSKFIIFQG